MCEYGLFPLLALERLGDAGVAPEGPSVDVLLSPGDTHRGAKDSAEPMDMLSLLFPLLVAVIGLLMFFSFLKRGILLNVSSFLISFALRTTVRE